MAKNSIPMPKAGGGVLSKLVVTLVGIAIVVLVVRYPSDAAAWVNDTMGFVSGAVEGLVTFLRGVSQ